MTLLIGIAGRKGAGKDTAAAGLIQLGFVNVKFAAPLKGMLRYYLEYRGVDSSTIQRMVEGDMKEEPSGYLCGRSSRYFQQMIGTEFGRNLIGEGMWTEAFVDQAALHEKVVCTDYRFPNEGEIIERLGGRRIKVVDPNFMKGENEHPSEAMVDDLPVDLVFYNDKFSKTREAFATEVVTTLFNKGWLF